MNQHVITTERPSIPFWRRRSVVATAFVALLAAGAGATVGALAASDSSVTYRYRSAPVASAASPVATCANTASLDGGDLLAVIAATPDGAARIAASLSPQVRQQIGDAVLTAAESSAYLPLANVPTMPDTAKLVVVLSHLDAADHQVILTGLPPEVQTEIGASLNDVAGLPTCP